MKLSSRLKIPSLLVAMAVILIGIGLISSSDYDAPQNPAITQQSVEAKINPASSASPGTDAKTAGRAPASQTSTPKLSNTGPGETAALFVLAATAGTAGAYIYQIKK